MNFLDTLAQRNKKFASTGFVGGLKMMPSQRTVIIGCVDPRVDPADVFGLETGETVVIRNVGGRVTKAALESLALVGKLAKAGGKEVGPGWNLVVLHHTDCGINGCSRLAPELLADHLGVQTSDFDAIGISDPYKSVAFDVAALQANADLPQGLTVSGVVYDVATGQAETVVAPFPLGGNGD
ncbi:carbonic anhydrase [Duganella aceris]|uniref:Carbonic anhydrase n=1 Tax=Duganella aceris TaxID=2703883 RepID=A0ABX0FGR0_9BURK|nr:carbonic anhydrase [Duganella aceris]NGZ83714.1 carbonic anhydrase [Duganella aceris]